MPRLPARFPARGFPQALVALGAVLIFTGWYGAVAAVLGILVKCQTLPKLGIFFSEQNDFFFKSVELDQNFCKFH